MAVSPKQLADELSVVDQEVVAVAESYIDNELRNNYGNSNQITVRVQDHWTPRIRTELSRRYMAVGWIVTYVADQREGCFLAFMERK